MKRKDFLKIVLGSTGALCLSSLPISCVSNKNKSIEKWNDIVENWKITSCNLCSDGCGIICRVVNGKVIKVKGNPFHPINKGTLCPKGQSSLQLLYHPNRIKAPLIKKGNGFEEISWDKALEIVAKELLKIKDKPNLLLFLKKEGFTLSDKLIENFMCIFGSPNLININSYSPIKTTLYLTQGLKEYPVYDLKNTNYILSFGTSLFEDFRFPVFAMKAYGYLRQGRKDKKIKLVQIESRFSTTAGRSDEFIAIKPGTEGIFALGVAYVLIKEELYNENFVKNCTFGFEDFIDEEGHSNLGFKNLILQDYRVDFVSEITGVSVETITKVAKEFALNQPSMAISDVGTNNYTNSTFNSIAIHSLNALCGNIDVQGGILYPEEIPYKEIEIPKNENAKYKRIDEANSAFPFAENVPETIAENILQNKSYDINVAFFYNTNPVFSFVNGKKFAEVLKQIPFKISFSQFLDETSTNCDLIIPDLTFFEKWDVVSSRASGFPVSGIIQPVVKRTSKSLSTSDFLIKLSQKLGGKFKKYLPFNDFQEMLNFSLEGLYKAQRGTTFSNDFEISFINSSEERGFWYPKYNSYKDFFEEITKSGGWLDPNYEYEGWGRVFQTKSNSFEFYSQNLKEKIEELSLRKKIAVENILLSLNIKEINSKVFLPHYEPAVFTGDKKNFPLLLIVYKTLSISSSDDANIPYLQEIYGHFLFNRWDSFVEVNPKTAKKLNIKDGEIVKVLSEKGSLTTKVKIYKGIAEDTIAIPFGQGHYVLKQFAENIGVNICDIVLQNFDKLSGNSALITTRVNIKKEGNV